MIREALLKLELPYVNQFILSGTPFLANIDAGVLNPLNLILLLGDFIFAYHLFVFVHLLLAAAAMNLFLRFNLRISPMASLPCSILYSFGYVWSSSGNGFYRCAYLVPLFFLFFINTNLLKTSCLKKRFLLFVGATISLSLLIICGNFLEACFTALLGISFMLFNFFILGFLRKKWKWKSLAASSAVFLFSGMLSAPQTIPSVIASLDSYRNVGIPLVEAQQWSFPPARLIEFIIPCAFGDRSDFGLWTNGIYTVQETFSKTGESPFADSIFIGLLPLLGLLIFIIRKPNRKNIFMLLALIFSFMLAIGKYSFVYRLFYHYLPGFKMFRHPEKFMFFVHFWLIACGAIGIDSIRKISSTLLKKVLISIGVFTLILCLVLFAGILLFILQPANFAKYFVGLGSLWNGDKIFIWLLSMTSSSIFALGLTLIAGKYLFNRRRWLISAFGAIAFCHALFVCYSVKWTIPRSLIENIEAWTSKIGDFDKLNWRIYQTGSFKYINKLENYCNDRFVESKLCEFRTLKCNLPALFGIRTVKGFSPLLSQKYSDIMNFEVNDPEKVLDQLSVKYIAARYLSPNNCPKNSRIIFSDEAADFSLIENLNAYPRVEALNQTLLSENNDSGKPRAFILECDSLNKVIVNISDGPGKVILRDFYMKGWTCRNSKGKLIDIERSKEGFMNVFCENRDDMLVFEFYPPGLSIGFLLALSAIVMMFLFFILIHFAFASRNADSKQCRVPI